MIDLYQPLPRYFCGLYIVLPPTVEYDPPKLKPFLLKDVHVTGKIVDNVADLVLTQKYYNDDDHAVVESMFFFPMHDSSIVHSVQAKIGTERIINAKIMDKNVAHESFAKAVDEGRTAAMMENLPESSDIFKLSLSHIPGKTEVVVTTKFCLPLKDTTDDMHPEDPASLLLLPGSLLHRYAPAEDPSRPSTGSTVSDAVGATLEDIHMYQRAGKPYPPLVIELAVESAYALADIRVPSHPDSATTTFSVHKGTGTVKVTLDADKWLDSSRHKDVHIVTIAKPHPIQVPPVKLVTPDGEAVEEDGDDEDDYVPVSAENKEKQRQYALRAMQLRVDAYTPDAEPGSQDAELSAPAETSFPAPGTEYLDYSTASAVALRLTIPAELARFVLTDAVPAVTPKTKQEDTRGLEAPKTEEEVQAAVDSMATELEKLELSLVKKEEDRPGEYIFLLDRSGSMGRDRMDKAKQSLQLALRSLPVGSTFQVIFFDTTYNAVFPSPVEFSDENLKKATEDINAIFARGGTEILQPLEFAFRPVTETKEVIGIKNDAKRTPVYRTHPVDSQGRERFVFLFTDGEVSNTEQVVSAARKAHEESGVRVFTIGIGTNCSTTLLEGLARVTNSRSEYIFDTEPFQAKVIGQMSAAMNGFYSLSVDWGFDNPDCVYKNALPEIEYKGSLHSTAPLSFYGLFKKKKDKETAKQSPLEYATLTVKHPRFGEKTVSLYSLPMAYVKAKTNTNALAMFAAKDAITSLQGKDPYSYVDHDRQKRIIALSTQYKVLSRFTAFFAEETEVKNKPPATERPKDPPQPHPIPVPIPVPMPIVRPVVHAMDSGPMAFRRGAGGPRMLGMSAMAAPMVSMMSAPAPAAAGFGMGAPAAINSMEMSKEARTRKAPAKKGMSLGSRVRGFFGGSANAAPDASFSAAPMMESAVMAKGASIMSMDADDAADVADVSSSYLPSPPPAPMAPAPAPAMLARSGEREMEKEAQDAGGLAGEKLMNRIVLLQNVAGVFGPLDQVVSLAKVPAESLASLKETITKQCPSLSAEDQDKALATLLALYVFENNLADLQSSWMFVARKARDALAKLTGLSKKDVTALVQSAKDVISA